MPYTPRNVPTDPAALPDYLRSELQRLALELSSAQDLLRVAQTNVTPTRPRAGDIRYADGTNWTGDGSSGEGFYWFDGTDWQPFGGGGSGATTFLGLTDTPSSYSAQASKFVKVNVAETALEFVASTVVGEPYDAGGFYPGTPGVSAVMTRHVFARAVDFPASLSGSVASAGTAATAQTDFLIKKNGTTWATMRFAASATTCTFVSVTTTSFAAGDYLTIIAPATPDATLADVGWMLKGTLG